MNICSPLLEINLKAIYHNAKLIVEKGKEMGIYIDGVTKVSLGDPKIADILVKAGVRGLSDSRIESIKRMREEVDIEYTLIRLPCFSQVEEEVKYADVSLNSEIMTLRALEEASERLGKKHKVIIMVEMGDIREGIWKKDELIMVVKEVLRMKNLELYGLGTNFTCFGGVVPTVETYWEFIDLVEKIEKTFSINLPLISAGNSSSIPLLFEGKIPKKINHLRIGEGIMLGKDTAFRNPIPGARLDTFRFIGEILEIKEKPSMPWGVINEDAFAHKPSFVDKGIRRRALMNFGRQDIDPQGIIPEIPGIEVLGATSDYTVVDIGDYDLKVGDSLSFSLNYSALLQAFTSPYVKKIYKE
uniref:Alanine/ornithine racemase family PLP-dependent enzyme n=1 Tax=Dictyoglomus thermophilum TaxID=14 RepID=A0A7C3RVS6_DICTH